MTTAKLSITLPDAAWVAQVTRAHPESTVTVLAAVPRETTGFGLARINAADIDPVLESVRDHDAILELEVIGRSNREATIQFQTNHPLLLFSARDSGMPLELPVCISDGVAEVEVTGSRDRLTRLGQQLRSFGLEFEVIYVQEYDNPSGMISERQREVLLTAVEEGYYDTPRRCSQTELAKQLDIAKSTCSETLHRAESEIITRFVEGLPAATSIETPVLTE